MNRAVKHIYPSFVPWKLMGGLFLSLILFCIYYTFTFSAATPSLYPDRATYVLIVVGIIYGLGLSALCFKGIARKRPRAPAARSFNRGFYLSPILLGLDIGVFALGLVAWLIETLVTGQLIPFPDPSGYVNLAMYPFLVGAILLLPAPNLSRLARARIFLDGLIIMAAITTLVYYFVLAPVLVYGNGTMSAKVVCNIFISIDLVLILCLILVVLRSRERVLRPVLLLLGCAVIVLLLTHILRTYELLYKGWYNYLSLVALGWPVAGIFTVGAAWTITAIIKYEDAAEQAPQQQSEKAATVLSDRRWQAALPALFVLAFAVLIIATGLSGGIETFPGQRLIVYGGAFDVLILMVLRQLLTLYQEGALQRQLQVKNRSLGMLNTYLETQATRDALTGLPNHRTVVEKLDEAMANARATQSNCSVIFMDVDEFKSINDTYGHITGDTVLTNFSAVVKSGLRANDWVGRWGGEEFVAILPDTEPLEALNLAEGLRKRVDQHVLAGNGEVNVTCSLGVASYPQDACDREELIAQADNAMYAAKRLGRNQTRSAHEPLVQAMSCSTPEPEAATHAEDQAMVEALLASLEARDPATVQHMRRVSTLSLKLAQTLGLNNDETHLVSLGGLLHDLGKLAIPDAILGKRASLNEEERASISQHPVTGAALLQPIHSLRAIAPIVRAHHEQLNGLGYPDGLRGEEIPLAARIIAVADVYDAMTSERPYHTANSPEKALQILQKGAGTHFDPRVVDTLGRLLATNPNLSSVA